MCFGGRFRTQLRFASGKGGTAFVCPSVMSEIQYKSEKSSSHFGLICIIYIASQGLSGRTGSTIPVSQSRLNV